MSKVWSINQGKTWYRFGQRIFLPANNYKITFSNVNGFFTPSYININIVAGFHSSDNIKYEVMPTNINTPISVSGLQDLISINSNMLISNLNGSITI